MYQENAKKALADIDITSKKTKAIFSKKPAPYLVFHDAYQYYEESFHLKPTDVLSIHPEVPISARKLQSINKKIRTQGIRCIFSEPQFSRKTIDKLLSDNPSLSHGVLDPVGDDKDIGPKGYITLLEGLTNTFQSCIK